VLREMGHVCPAPAPAASATMVMHFAGQLDSLRLASPHDETVIFASQTSRDNYGPQHRTVLPAGKTAALRMDCALA